MTTSTKSVITRLTFGPATETEFDTNSSVAEGGWVNVTLPILYEGAKVGTAGIGVWVYATTAGNISADIYDEVKRTGWAIRAYRGEDRVLAWDRAAPDEVVELDEDAVLDLADDADPTDYETLYRDELLAALPEYDDRPVVLAVGADTTHDTAEQWYDDLGHHVTDDAGDDIAHPICAIDEVDGYEPTSDAETELLKYARAAKDAAETVEAELADAIKYYARGDLRSVIESLGNASRAECEYGDDPATQSLAGRLLADAEEEATHRLIEALS